MASFKGDGKAIFMVLIGALIATVFLMTIADENVAQTSNFNANNTTVTAPTVNSSTDLTGRELVGTGEVVNSSGTDVVGLGVLLRTGTSSTSGLRTVQIFTNDTGSHSAGDTVNVTYIYRPDGYHNDAGTRSIVLLITLIAALAIVVFVIVVFAKHGSLSKLLRRS